MPPPVDACRDGPPLQRIHIGAVQRLPEAVGSPEPCLVTVPPPKSVRHVCPMAPVGGRKAPAAREAEAVADHQIAAPPVPLPRQPRRRPGRRVETVSFAPECARGGLHLEFLGLLQAPL